MLRVAVLALLLCLSAGARSEQRYDSWQVRHPVMTAFISTVSLLQLPVRFGDDIAPVEDRMENGWTSAALELLMPHAKKAYQRSRIIISIFEVLLISFAILKARQKVGK
jgi:hypothetical protein